MRNIEVTAPARSHLLEAVRALAESGWQIERAPELGALERNGQLLHLRSSERDVRVRLFVYKVTGSGRSRPDERRIEITNTYQKRLKKTSGHADVVLGYDQAHAIFVGVDPRRLAEGGRTGNASSFFDRAGLEWANDAELLIRPRDSRLFPEHLEYHAFIRAPRLAEYLFNTAAIHDGTYTGGGIYAGQTAAAAHASLTSDEARGNVLVLMGPQQRPRQRRINRKLLDSLESGDLAQLKRKAVTPEEFQELQRLMAENGQLGEQFVLNHERVRLRKAGVPTLAQKVAWISQNSVCEGFDIRSYEVSGEERLIEVKATSGRSRSFEMSQHEWETAIRSGTKYFIYRVTEIRDKPRLEVVRSPADLEALGQIAKTPTGWRVTLR